MSVDKEYGKFELVDGQVFLKYSQVTGSGSSVGNLTNNDLRDKRFDENNAERVILTF